MEEKIIYLIKEKLSNEYHNFLDNKNEESKARLTVLLELSYNIRNISGIFENKRYSEFFKYMEKVESSLNK